MTTDNVTITHPKTGGVTTVTVRAYERVWKARGWEPTEDSTAAVAAAETDDLSKLLKEDLVALAEQRGVDTSGTKEEIITRLEEES